jgi:hypothetical protein
VACGFILLLATFISSLPVQSQNSGSREALSCKLVVENRDWHTNQPAMVQVELRNASDRAIQLSVVPIFYLVPKFSPRQWPANREGYWAPTNIVENHALETDTVGKRKTAGMTPRKLHLTIEKHSTSVYQVDMILTRWEWRPSALWPNLPLAKLVISGKHVLSLEIGDEMQIPCNKVEVQITKELPPK